MEWVSGNIYIRPATFELGQRMEGHAHNFDHTTIVFTGAVHVDAKLPSGGVQQGDFTAPSHFLVRANVEHTITATAPHTVFWCVYSHREPQGQEIVQEYTGWGKAYE